MRRFALIALKLVVTALLLYFATRRINFGVVIDRMNRLELPWLLLAAVLGLVQAGVGAIRWHHVAVLCGGELPAGRALRFSLIGAFFNQVLPSMVGGDAAKIVLLARAGVKAWTAAYSVLLDRFVGVLVLAALVTAGLYWSFERISDPTGRLVLLAVGIGSLSAGAAFLLIGLWQPLPKWKLLERLTELSILARRVLFSGKRSLLIVTLSVLIHAMTALIAWMAARAVMSPLGYLDALLLVLPVILIATIPVSIGGWGLRESALVLAFSYAGLPESDGLIVSVLLGGVLFVVGVVGGAVWLASPDRRTAVSQPENAFDLKS